MDVRQVLSQMSLLEKCRLLVGDGPWHFENLTKFGVPHLMMTDGPHGIRKELPNKGALGNTDSYPAVCFPPAVSLASSFDTALAFDMGKAIGKAALAKEVAFVLGPGMNIKRSPLCGRNFEYFSEDPKVTSDMARAVVRGIQSVGVGATPKHFALNNQETLRFSQNSVVDVRAMQEIYLKPFKEMVKEEPAMFMCSYNRQGNTLLSENKYMLKDLLRDKFGYEGVIVSDWTSVSNRVRALMAGLDLEMPGHDYSVKLLLEALRKQEITETMVDESCLRILDMIQKYQPKDKAPDNLTNMEENHKTAKRVAKESIVLLKNEGNILPLKRTQSVALIGKLAKEVRYQGGGSSHIHPYDLENFVESFPTDVDFGYAEGYKLSKDGYYQNLINDAVMLAKTKDVAIVVIGLTEEYESEGYDRMNLDLPLGHNLLVEEVVKVNPNTIVVVQCGSPVLMPWLDKVRGVFNMYLAGESGASAMLDLIYGKDNPSGRLAETFPLEFEKHPLNQLDRRNHQVYYQESIFVGYRYYQTFNHPVLFPFGYGLSYSRFEYSDFKVDKTSFKKTDKIRISMKIKNVSSMNGKEVVFLFIGNNQSPFFKAKRGLRQFQKVYFTPDEEKEVVFTMTTKDIEFYHPDLKEFVSEPGKYQIEIRKNALEGIFEQEVGFVGDALPKCDRYYSASSYFSSSKERFTSHDFEELIGQKMVFQDKLPKPYTIDHTLNDMKKNIFGRLLKKAMMIAVKKQLQGQSNEFKEMVMQSFLDTPVRSIAIFSGGMVSMEVMNACVAFANGHVLQGISHLFRKDAPHE